MVKKLIDNVRDSKCGLPGPGDRFGILCAYSSLGVLGDVLKHVLLVSQDLYQHHSFFRKPHPKSVYHYQVCPKTFNRIKMRMVRYTLHDLNPQVLQEACYHSGCIGSCIVLLEQSDLRVCFHTSLKTSVATIRQKVADSVAKG